MSSQAANTLAFGEETLAGTNGFLRRRPLAPRLGPGGFVEAGQP
ncbi:hypothetical protein BH24ACT26_BH24ACT26_23430 [soil metagenome]